MSYEIIRYAPDHRDGVLELQTHLWSPDRAVNAAYLEWKYERNPYMDVPFIHLAVSGGRVVGMRGMYGAKWEVGQPPERFVGPCGGDLVVAPEHRSHRLARAIVERAASDLAGSGFAYSFSLSAATVTQLVSLTVGWRSLGSAEPAVWRSAGPGTGDPPLGAERGSAEERPPFDSLDRNGARRGRVSVDTAPRPDAMADLVERIGSDGRLRHVRDAEYFAWRFRNPLSLYRFVFWADARLEGYLVLQTPSLRASRPVTIVDWEATGPQAGAELLRAALHWGRFEQVATWTASLPAGAKAMLQEEGFQCVATAASVGRAHRDRTSRPTIMVSAVQRDAPATDWAMAGRALLDLANWDVRAIYSDTF